MGSESIHEEVGIPEVMHADQSVAHSVGSAVKVLRVEECAEDHEVGAHDSHWAT